MEEICYHIKSWYSWYWFCYIGGRRKSVRTQEGCHWGHEIARMGTIIVPWRTMEWRKSPGDTQRLLSADRNKNVRRGFTENTEPQDTLTSLWEVFNIQGQPRSKTEHYLETIALRTQLVKFLFKSSKAFYHHLQDSSPNKMSPEDYKVDVSIASGL